MAFGVVRLTLYALIGAIESDLRLAITGSLLIDKTAKGLLPPPVYERAFDRMKRDVGTDSVSEAQIFDYLDFAECIEVLSASRSNLTGPIAKAVKRLSQKASILIPIRNRVMHSRPLEYDDLAHVTDLSRELLSFPTSLFPTLRQTEQTIKQDPSYIFSLKLEDLRSDTGKVSHNLPLPDFDETGFLGRADEERSLLRICKASPWPVVTILGEGGVGKSTLALKVGYDLLDDPETKFDAIIWSTSKTTKLTVSDIQKIDGAIQNSVGLFQDISRSLLNTAESVDELLQYVNSFNILLILDNLETVLDENIRSFLAGITSTSKVLITSRIGLGELEYRFPLRTLKDEDAISLLRATAQVRRVEQITRTSNAVLKEYCSKMTNNPLFIKWFVSCVQSGKRPEETLQNPKVLLDFCLANVVEHLSDDARLVAKAMVSITEPQTQSLLSYLTELDGDRLQLALQQLITANIATLVALPAADGYESSYDLGYLPRLYLLKSYPPTANDVAKFGKRRTDLARTHAQIKARSVVNPYASNTVAIRARDDVVVAKYLTEALVALRQKRYTDVVTSVEAAKRLNPTYAEVYRVEGWAQYIMGNYAAAQEAYQTAIELEPRSAVVRYWYAGFVLRAHEDAEGTAKELKLAQQLDPISPEIRVEYSRVLAYLFKFDEADLQLQPVLDSGAGSTKLMRVAYDGLLQIAKRRAEFCFENADFLGTLEALEDALLRFERIPGEYIDQKMFETMASCIYYAQSSGTRLRQSEAYDRAQTLYRKLVELRDVNQDHQHEDNLNVQPSQLRLGETGAGEIARIDFARNFGFIRSDGGGTLFFHRNFMNSPIDFRMLKSGQRVNFVVGQNQAGLAAEKVEVHATPASDEKELYSFGEIDSVDPSFNFGFIRCNNEHVYFHRNDLKSPRHMSMLFPGISVKFRFGRNDRGKAAIYVEQLYTTLLDDALISEKRLSAQIFMRKADATYAIANTTGGTVLIRSQDFRDPKEWDALTVGDWVSFLVAIGNKGAFIGRDIQLDGKFWDSTRHTQK